MGAPERFVAALAWIPVEQGLPDSDTTVLVYAPDGDEPVWLGFYGDPFDGADAGLCWRYINNDQARGVTHWAVLPEGPR